MPLIVDFRHWMATLIPFARHDVGFRHCERVARGNLRWPRSLRELVMRDGWFSSLRARSARQSKF